MMDDVLSGQPVTPMPHSINSINLTGSGIDITFLAAGRDGHGNVNVSYPMVTALSGGFLKLHKLPKVVRFAVRLTPQRQQD